MTGMLRRPEIFVACSAAIAIAAAIAACVGDDPAVVTPPDAAPDVQNGADSSSGTVGKGCQLPHSCQGMREPSMCAPLALSPGVAAQLLLHVDACKVSSPQEFRDETGRYTIEPSANGDYCANSLLNNGPALQTPMSNSGFLVKPVDTLARDFYFTTSPFAILVVALQRAGMRSNQVLFSVQEQAWPYRGPAIVTNFAWAASDADGGFGSTAGLGTPTNYVAGQMWWGGDPLTDAASPGLASLSTLPFDCAPHVFRFSRSGATFSLYVDGNAQDVERATEGDGGPVNLTGAPIVWIGNGANGGQNLDGAIGEIVVVRDTPDDAVLEIETALKRRWKIP
jgi:hypothetical protein